MASPVAATDYTPSTPCKDGGALADAASSIFATNVSDTVMKNSYSLPAPICPNTVILQSNDNISP